MQLYEISHTSILVSVHISTKKKIITLKTFNPVDHCHRNRLRNFCSPTTDNDKQENVLCLSLFHGLFGLPQLFFDLITIFAESCMKSKKCVCVLNNKLGRLMTLKYLKV